MSTQGREGAKFLYPTSNTNPQYYIHGHASHVIKGDKPSNGRFGGGGQQRRCNVVAQGAGSCEGAGDHGQTLSRGYMCSPRDWRNVEMSLGIGENWTGEKGITLYCRGGKESGNHGCEGFSYKCTLTRDGLIRMAKESWHVQYDYWDDTPWTGGPNCGMKFCCYDNGQFVTLECWIDVGRQNNWKMIKKEVDNGFGRGGAGCGGRDGGPGLWGGPFATMRSDEDEIDLDYFSIREINPFASFQGSIDAPNSYNPGSNAYGDSANGGGFPANFGGQVYNNNLGTGYTSVARAGHLIAGGGPSGSYEGPGIQGGGGGGGFTGPDSTTTEIPQEGSQLGDSLDSPITTVFKDFYDRYDLNAVSANACGVGTYNEAKDLVELFRGSSTPNYLKMCTTGFDAKQVGQKIITAQSQLFNKIPRRVETTFKKFGSPSGDIFCRIRDKKGVLKQELGMFAAAAVGLNDTQVYFQDDDAAYKMQIGDVLWIEYTADGDGTAKYLLYKRGDSDADDAFNSWFAIYTSTTIEDQLNDLAAAIYE